MEDESRALAGAPARLGRTDVLLQELDAVERFREVLPLAGREVVHRPDPGAPLEQRVHEVRPDEPGRAGDEDALAVEFREHLDALVPVAAHALTTLGSVSL